MRGGIFYSELDSRGDTDPISGRSFLAGIGYEYDWDNLGVSFEFDYRYVTLHDKSKVRITMYAIGFHFYSM